MICSQHIQYLYLNIYLKIYSTFIRASKSSVRKDDQLFVQRKLPKAYMSYIGRQLPLEELAIVSSRLSLSKLSDFYSQSSADGCCSATHFTRKWLAGKLHIRTGLENFFDSVQMETVTRNVQNHSLSFHQTSILYYTCIFHAPFLAYMFHLSPSKSTFGYVWH